MLLITRETTAAAARLAGKAVSLLRSFVTTRGQGQPLDRQTYCSLNFRLAKFRW